MKIVKLCFIIINIKNRNKKQTNKQQYSYTPPNFLYLSTSMGGVNNHGEGKFLPGEEEGQPHKEV